MANLTVTINSGTSISSAAPLGLSKLRGVQIPSSWTVAPISFLGSADGVTFLPIFRDGNEVIEPVWAGTVAKLDASDFAGTTQIQIRSGSMSAPVVQTSAETLTLIVE